MRIAARSVVRQAFAVLVAACAVSGRLGAQATGSVAVTADVNTTALTTTTTQNLDFGTVVAGTPTTVDPKTGTTEGYLVVQGARNAQIRVTFTLPTVLMTGPGAWSMPVSFGATSGCSLKMPQHANCNYFDPNVPLVDRLRNQNAPNNHYHIWLGGQVTPSATQHAGVYRATITATVVYTGL